MPWPNVWNTADLTFSRAPEVDGRIAEIGRAALYVTDGRSATQRAAESGVANTVLIDLALDYSKASRLAIAAAEQCEAAAASAAIGLLQAAGFAVSRFLDVPGLAVHAHRRHARQRGSRRGQSGRLLRKPPPTRRCASASITRKARWPGPIRSASPVIRDVLANLGASYGEDRYRISPLLQRAVFAGRKIHD